MRVSCPLLACPSGAFEDYRVLTPTSRLPFSQGFADQQVTRAVREVAVAQIWIGAERVLRFGLETAQRSRPSAVERKRELHRPAGAVTLICRVHDRDLMDRSQDHPGTAQSQAHSSSHQGAAESPAAASSEQGPAPDASCCRLCSSCPGFRTGNPTTDCAHCGHTFQSHKC